MLLKNYIIAFGVNYGIVPCIEMIAVRGPLRNRLYGEGTSRRIYFSKDALRKLGITHSNLRSFVQLPLLSPVEVSELNQAAQEYQKKYGIASLKKGGREQGRFFSRKRSMRGIIPGDPLKAHKFLMNCFSLSIGAKDYMKRVEIGRFSEYGYLERHFPFELAGGKMVSGEKYFWTFIQGVLSTGLCHNKQMRAEVTRKDNMVHILSKSVDDWGDYLLDNIDNLF